MRNLSLTVCVLLYGVLFGTFPVFGQEVNVEEAFSETFAFPLGFENSHSGSSFVYVVRRGGQIDRLDTENTGMPSVEWLDISDRVTAGGERGLLGLAFPPDYPANESFYLYYTFEDDGQLYSTLARFQAPGGVADTESEERLFEIEQPRSNHNGGHLKFGPDGYLYIASGDGGGNSRVNSQINSNLLGKILRIDVSPSSGYDIPTDNPFAGDPEYRDEIYAWGFRNPWRMSFDPETGNLWVADVGERDWESIYIVGNGLNYGWPVVEGSECFEDDDCDKTGLEMPLFEYPWDNETGNRSITGGYVYRGSANPSLQGRYIYGDYMSGRIWALEVNHDTRAVISNTELYHADFRIPSFGKDSNGEIYIVGWGDEAGIYRFVPEEPGEDPALPSQIVLESPSDGASGVPLQPELTWQADSEAEIYEVQLATDSVFNAMVLDETGLTQTTFTTDDPLDYDTTFFWRVRGVNQDGEGQWSEPRNFTTKSPPAVEGLVLTEQEGALKLEWQLSATGEVNGYNIFRGPSVAALEIISTVQANTQEFVDSDLPDGTSLYAVTAVDVNGQESDFSSIVSYYNAIATVTQEWKLVSIPIHHEGIELTNSDVFSFSRVYQPDNTLLPTKGYWVRSLDGEDYSTKGKGVEEASLTLNSGWNLIGGLIDQVPVETIDDPSGILTAAPVYGFNDGSYREVPALMPSEGHWIYASEEGTINLEISSDISTMQSSPALAGSARHMELQPDRIIFSRNEMELGFWVTDTGLGQNEKYRYLLPPQSPEPVLDVRTDQGYKISDSRSTLLKLTSSGYPVGVSTESGSDGDHIYRIVAVDEDGGQKHINLIPGRKQVISREYASLTLEKIQKDDAILETAMDPGYPNPFNPATNIRYQLAQQADVRINVFDVVGRRVATLVHEVQQPGVYTVQFDGANLASGIYLLRFQAGSFADVQKLTLIK